MMVILAPLIAVITVLVKAHRPALVKGAASRALTVKMVMGVRCILA